MKNLSDSLSSKFYLYESEKQNRQGENTKCMSSQAHHRQSIDTIQYSSKQKNYIQKLQFKYQQLSKIVQASQNQIKHLQDENNCLKKICQKQQQKISQSKNQNKYVDQNIEMMKEEYKREIQQLMKEKEKMTQLIMSITEEHKKEMVELTRYTKRVENDLEQIQTEDKRKQHTFIEKIQLLQGQISNLKLQLDEKRNVQKKYKLALKNIDRMEKSVSRPKDREK